jgi:hypothetical protein
MGVTDSSGNPITYFGDPQYGEPGEFEMLKA